MNFISSGSLWWAITVVILLFMLPDNALSSGSWQWKSNGQITTDLSFYRNDHNSATEDYSAGFYTNLELIGKGKAFNLNLKPAGIIDFFDTDRNRVYIEQGYLEYETPTVNARLGAQRFNWSSTEVFHPADVMNSRNFDTLIEEAERIGEPALTIRLSALSGSLLIGYMPYYQKPYLPSSEAREAYIPRLDGYSIGDPIFIDTNGAVSDDHFGNQGMVRIEQTLDNIDFSLFGIYQLDRDFRIAVVDASTATLSPLYQRKIAYGGTLTHIWDALITKIEIVQRAYGFLDDSVKQKYQMVSSDGFEALKKTDDHTASVLSFEYSFDVFEDAEIMMMLEWQRLWGIDEKERAQIEYFQSDIYMGFRLAMNDILNKVFQAGIIFDTERNNEYWYHVKYSQQINDYWAFQIGSQGAYAPKKDEHPLNLETIHEDYKFYLHLTRFF